MKHRKRWMILSLLAVLATTVSLIPRRIAIEPPVAQAATVSNKIDSTSTVKQYVEAQAKLLGVSIIPVDWILDHESQDGTNMKGDDGKSIGYWMIYLAKHPEVSYACAMNLQCSTQWTLTQILKGNINWWTTWKYRCTWFAKQNPPSC